MSRHWLESLDAPARVKADALMKQLRELGSPDPARWAKDAVLHNRPQLAAFLLLRHCWSETIDLWRDDLLWLENLVAEARNDPSGQFADAGLALIRLFDAGVEPSDIGKIARFVAYEAVFSLLHTLDEGYDPQHEGTLPGWSLVERDTVGRLTGRPLTRLHGELLSVDPSGREGRPG